MWGFFFFFWVILCSRDGSVKWTWIYSCLYFLFKWIQWSQKVMGSEVICVHKEVIMVVLNRSKQREISRMIREKGRIDGTTHRSEGWKPTRVEGPPGLSWDDGTLRFLWDGRHWQRCWGYSGSLLWLPSSRLGSVKCMKTEMIYTKKAVWLNRIQTNQKANSNKEIACLGEQLRTAQNRARRAQAVRITAGPSPQGGGRKPCL